MFESEAHVGIGGEMKDGVAAGHRFGQCGQVEIVATDEGEFWILFALRR